MARQRAGFSPRSEADVRKGILKRIHDLFPDSYRESNSPGPWGSSGRPDIELCISHFHGRRGVYAGLELKNPDYLDYPWRGLSEEQAIKLRDIARSGGLALLTNKVPFPTSDNRWALQVWVLNPQTSVWEPAHVTARNSVTYVKMKEEPA